ncbi:MAG: hypothetical protein RL662_2399 [Bacteroidota bacterium]|jgi:hypothetical protein
MRQAFFLLLVLPFLLTSCGPDPLKYNDNLVDHIEDANSRAEKLNSEIEDILESGDFTKIKERTKVAVDSLNLDIEKINNLGRPSGAEEFHQATVEYIKSLVVNADVIGTQYSLLNDTISDAEFERISKPIEDTEKVSDEKFEKMIEAQKVFAKAKNFELKKTY